LDHRILLHFGAVDWQAIVYLNGERIGKHEGGYDPFSFDITDHLKEGYNELVVRVWDPTNEGYQPRGKQHLDPHGIWFTAVTGIWQSVWLEPVPQYYIKSIRLTPNVTTQTLTIQVNAISHHTGIVYVVVKDREHICAKASNRHDRAIQLLIPNPKLWSPDSPFLYDVEITLANNHESDTVKSYFGMRKVQIKKDDAGFARIFLNGEPLFQYGPLDQGYWPDGLYTAPTDEALKYDVQLMKQLGFNMARKHVKVEHARWYYWCDKLGLMVWQDMPSGGGFVKIQRPDLERSAESEANYRNEYRAMVNHLYNHPSIIAWVPFNEGWGQFKTNEVLEWAMRLDPTRLIDGPSGWQDRGVGHMLDMHRYPGPAMPPTVKGRAAVLGEFGSFGCLIEGHLQTAPIARRRTGRTRNELLNDYRELIEKLKPLIAKGLSAAIYTQISDTEREFGGFVTYDRAVVKMPPMKVNEINQALYKKPPIINIILTSAEQDPETSVWKFTNKTDSDDWFQPDFDDSAWKTGKAPFATQRWNPFIQTAWQTDDIYLRRRFELNEIPSHHMVLNIRNDDSAEVYLNGQLLVELPEKKERYELVECNSTLRRLLRIGINTLAIHCRHTDDNQFIDAGILEVIDRDPHAWAPVKGHIMTPWAKNVTPDNAWPEYPRPKMVREDWANLNGMWQYAKAEAGEQPLFSKDLNERILVPFPVESPLSGIGRRYQ